MRAKTNIPGPCLVYAVCVCLMAPVIMGADESAESRIAIWPREKADRPVSRLLYGKFTEHLWRNIYHGMWAQVLVNPGFEDWRWFGRNRREALDRADGFSFRMERLVRSESLERAVAIGWLPFGGEKVDYALDKDAVHAEQSQAVKTDLPPGKEGGIVQAIFLPLHRQGAYTVSLHAKGETVESGLRVLVTPWIDRKRILASGRITGITQSWRPYTLTLKLPRAGAPDGPEKGEPLALFLALSGKSRVNLDQVFLFPRDHVNGFDCDVVRLIKDSRLPILRYPGGNFVSGYHWRDGVGPVNKRPMTFNAAWNHMEYNHVGTAEFVQFCRAVDCAPMICVNAGNGTPEEAAQWLEYCNGGVDTRFGALRKKHGHGEPFNIRYWEIGNELYGSWQIGHCTPDEYAERYEKFHRAMKAVDPSIRIIANGQDRRWNAPLIQRKSRILRSLSIHTLVGGGMPADTPPDDVFRSLMAYTHWYEGHLRSLGRQMGERVETPCLAVTELQIFTNKPGQPNNTTLSEALFLSGIINSCIRLDGLVEMITHSALVNHGGGLRKFREMVYANPVHWASHLYGNLKGRWPVKLTVACPRFDVPGGRLPAVRQVPYLDAIALLDDTATILDVMVTNRHPSRAISARIDLDGFAIQGPIALKTVGGESYMARNSWHQPERVSIVDAQLTVKPGESPAITFPAHSLSQASFRLSMAAHGRRQ